MTKLALCIRSDEAPLDVIAAYAGDKGVLLPIPASFWETPTELVDRAVCETSEVTLQLLPYIRVVSHEGQTFMYTRGGGGAEARLHGNYSVGVGGHVDVHPNARHAGYLYGCLQDEARREIKEETGLDIPLTEIQFTHFICDPTNPVGRVHLGILATVQLSENVGINFATDLEKGTIENARLVNFGDLTDNPSEFARLENWSALVVDQGADSDLEYGEYDPEEDECDEDCHCDVEREEDRLGVGENASDEDSDKQDDGEI
jgi:predicted NUDIX family phosphoesterase